MLFPLVQGLLVESKDYLKRLFDQFVTKIYLYDDEIRIAFSGTKVMTLRYHSKLLMKQRNWLLAMCSIKLRKQPPYLRNPNFIPIGNGFGFLVFIKDIEV